ncbi:MAG TPA: DedA family protein [Intrasporangium sp.]|uniref:DedA family protein n=1 Tax=Intrasporangium sp. TaxID=1925024 RepID=UPI002B468675|nr:DedA family protein [Intrasporangium sp.]HKX65978.1 DedA family protein [Intrasporangium sp.]
MLDVIDAVNSFIEANASTPWALVVLFVLTVVDSTLPPLPSESVLIALAAFGASTGSPPLVVLAGVAALGAWSGDNLAYTLARHSPMRRLRDTRSPRLRSAFGFAAGELDRRGGLFIVVGRYIPVGRVAVNLTAGASEFPRRRFLGLTALAGTTWSAYSVGVGALAGAWLQDNPLLGAAAGIGVAVVIGAVIDRMLRARRVGLDRREPRSMPQRLPQRPILPTEASSACTVRPELRHSSSVASRPPRS